MGSRRKSEGVKRSLRELEEAGGIGAGGSWREPEGVGESRGSWREPERAGGSRRESERAGGAGGSRREPEGAGGSRRALLYSFLLSIFLRK